MSPSRVPPAWLERVEALAGRRRETALVGVVVAVLVFIGVGVAARGSPAVIAPPATATPTPVPSSLTGSPLVVHVAGAVEKPGVFELPPGSRIADAIAVAGGALPRADLDLVNLAAYVVDGTQILVPARGDVPTAISTSLPGSTQSAPTVDLNTADQAMLESVPGLGPVKAAAIIAFRTEAGGFGSIEELLEVSGIGPATLDSIRPFVSI